MAVLAAKAFFILAGVAQQAGLSAALGQEGYGALARVLAVSNVVNNVVVAGSTQGVSRAVAHARGDEPGAIRGALRIHVVLATLTALAFALAAPFVARFQRAPEITGPLLVMTGVVLSYGLYAPLVGSLNGRGLFVKQARLDVLFAALRTGLMIAVAFSLRHAGQGVLGATVGFVVAAVIILLVATRVAGTGKTSANPAVERGNYLRALGPLVLAQLFVNLVMQADIVLLGRYLVDGAENIGLRGAAASDAANAWVAVYRACQLFAFLPYQLLLSLTQVLFPMLAHAHAEKDAAKVREYVLRGARLGAIATGALVSIVAATPQSLIGFLYHPNIATEGAHTLRILALAQGVFAMLAIGGTILASVSRERAAAGVTLLALLLSIAACVLTVPRADFGEPRLLASATAVGAALLFSLVVAAALVKRATGAFVPFATALRVVLAVAITVAVGSLIPPTGRLITPLVCLALGALYLVLLTVTRELSRSDADSLRSALRARAQKREVDR